MEYIYYTFLAGWCADAAGARLEFRKKKFKKVEVVNAMYFIGEKTNGINEGQFTDDSEMELALLTGLIKGKNDEYFPIEKIAKEYIKWYKSRPFDIGQTTLLSLCDATNADEMANNAFEYNEDSESNGSLMRCIPIAVVSLLKTNESILEIAELDASLTHHSYVVKLITGIYCCIISKILSKYLTEDIVDIEDLLEDIKILSQKNEKVHNWFIEGINMICLDKYDAINNEGHVKHAFIIVIYFLKNIKKYSYENAIIEVLKLGGDTDTNAKIVGNLFGAYYGKCVPEYMSMPVLQFDCTKSDNKHFRRPAKYGIKNGIKLIEEIKCKYI